MPCLPPASPWTAASLFLALRGPHTICSYHAGKTVSGSPDSPWEGTGCRRKGLQSWYCPAPRGKETVPCHPPRPSHASWALPASLEGDPPSPGTSGRDFPFCHPAEGNRLPDCGLWTAWGYLSGQSCLTTSVLTSHAWGRKGKQTGHANGVMGKALLPA